MRDDEESGAAAGLETNAMLHAVGAKLFAEAIGPARVGRFVLGDRIGRGGMGVVYAAKDHELDREIAIKLVSRMPGEDAEPRARLMVLEARALATLSHPNIVPVLDVGLVDGGVYIAMELVRGRTLLEHCDDIAPGESRWAKILDLARQAAQGLAAAHAAGVVHRDVKPGNLLVGEDGRLRLIDFGLARSAPAGPSRLGIADGDLSPGSGGDSAPTPRATVAAIGSDRLLTTGQVVGTPAYMAPEQFDGRATPKSDQFAWAVVFWEALFGVRPFAGATWVELVDAIEAGDIRVGPRGHRVPRRVRRALERALRAREGDRFASMQDALAAIGSRGKARWIALPVALGLAAAAFWSAGDSREAHCAESAAAIDEAWGPSARTDLRTALVGEGGPLGQEAWERLEPRLDAYAQSWGEARLEACVAAGEAPPSQMREASIACLEGRRDNLARRVRVLTDSGADSASNALTAAAGLPSIDNCSDAAWLEAQVKPPSDPQRRAEAAALSERIEEVAALQNLGDNDGALERLRELFAAARSLDHPPLLTRIFHVRGHIHDDLGDEEAALDDYRNAYFLAAEHGDHTRAAEAAAELAYVYGDRLRQPERAQAWLGHMDAALTRAPDPTGTLRADAEIRRATVLHRRGERLGSLKAVEAAVEAFTAAGGPDDARIPAALVVAADVHRELGEPEAAWAAGDRALSIAQDALGPTHPLTTLIHSTQCGSALEAGDPDAAEPHCMQAHAGTVANPRGDSPALAGALNNLGFLAIRRNDLETGLERFKEALALLEAGGRGEHAYAAQTLQNIALCLEQLGRGDESLEAMDRAIELTQIDAEPRALAIVLYNAGTVAHRKRLFDRATAYLRRAIAAAPGPEMRSHQVILEAKQMLGAMEVDASASAVALPLLEDALQGFEARPTMNPASTAATRLYLARALVDTGGDRERALALARQAAADFAKLDPPNEEAAAEAQALISRHGQAGAKTKG